MTDAGQPLDKAAEILGKSPRTVLRWIHAGKIPATKVDGEWQVDVSGVRPDDRTDVSPELQAEVQDLKEEIAMLRDQLAQKDKQISELHILLGREQQKALPPGRRWWQFWRRG